MNGTRDSLNTTQQQNKANYFVTDLEGAAERIVRRLLRIMCNSDSDLFDEELDELQIDLKNATNAQSAEKASDLDFQQLAKLIRESSHKYALPKRIDPFEPCQILSLLGTSLAESILVSLENTKLETYSINLRKSLLQIIDRMRSAYAFQPEEFSTEIPIVLNQLTRLVRDPRVSLLEIAHAMYFAEEPKTKYKSSIKEVRNSLSVLALKQ